MGSCASAHPHTVDISVDSGRDKDSRHVYCVKHPNNIVTHYNETTYGLYCLTCFQNYKRSHTLSESLQIHDVSTYIKTVQFKQMEAKVLEKLRTGTRTTQDNLSHISQVRNKLETKQKEVLDEIHAFIQTLIEILNHLENELCREVNQEIYSATTELNEIQTTWLDIWNKVTNVKMDIEKNRNENPGTRQLEAVVNCRSVIKIFSETQHTIPEFEMNLKLNKSLTLRDITSRRKDAQDIRLGNVICQRREFQHNVETLSDISEVDEAHVEDEITPNADLTVGDHSLHVFGDSQTETKCFSKVPKKQLLPTTPSTIEDTDTHTRKAEFTQLLDAHTTVRTGSSASSAYDNSTGNMDVDITEKVIKKPADNLTDKTQRHDQFLRDFTVSRYADRRSSNTNVPTPRRSSQSVVSPGNITTPLFISPRPGHSRITNERKIPTLRNTVTLHRDVNVHNITDSAIIENEYIVLCDQKNGKLILLDIDLETVNEIELNSYPHNITAVPGTRKKIAATIPDENVVKIVEIENGVFSDSIEVVKLQSKPKCRGIEYIDGNLMYTTRNDVAVVRKEDTTKTWKFKYAFRDPVSLNVDHKSGAVFVSCLGLKTFGEVVKMRFNDEKIDFIISFNEIQHPVCSTTDDEGYIYVCDIDPPSIHQVSPRGNYCQRILSGSDTRFQHINFIPWSKRFLATANDSDVIQIYEMI